MLRPMLEKRFQRADVSSVSTNKTGPVKHGHFTASIMTFSLRGRLAVTVPVVLIGLFLFLNLVSDALADDPRPAALVFLLFGIWAFVAWRVLHHLWRPDIDWAAERRDSNLDSEHIRANVEDLPQTHLSFVTFHPDVSESETRPPPG